MPAIPQRLRAERDRFVGFAFAHADLLVELDAAGRIAWADGAFRYALGIDVQEVIGTPLAGILAPEDIALLHAALNLLKPGQRRRDLPIALQDGKNASIPASISVNRSVVQDEQVYFLSISVGSRHAAARMGAASRNRVSGLLEAAEFTQVASDAIRRARASGSSACLTLLEICEVAELERLLGPGRSDSLLAEIGAELKLHAMDFDSAAQLGDGRFGVAHFDDSGATAIVAAIMEIGRRFDLDADKLNLSDRSVALHDAAIGDGDVESILAYVVERFSRDGTAGLEQGVTAAECLRRMTAETLSRVVTMRDLIHEHRISLHFQPIVRLKDREPHHFEVLLRFSDGRSPFEDVKFAEEINIIHELDLAVTHGAIQRIAEAGKHGTKLHLAINMSARSLLNDTFLEMFDELAQRLGDMRDQLIVEVTESAKLDDLAKAAWAVGRLRSGRHAVCLDDFGAGASSLPYLQQLTVDYVKIDGVYIRSIAESARERAIVQGVLTTCRCLGIRTVAEMVEKEDQHKCLADLGVDMGQGWLYGRPSSATEGAIAKPPPIKAARPARRQEARDLWG